MTRLLHRKIDAPLPTAVGGSGMELVDRQGRRYLDACGGAAVSCLGHGHPAILKAMHEQIDALAYAHTAFFTTEVAEQLADELVASAPGQLSYVYLVSGGSEAVEAALKMARQYHVERGEGDRRHIISRQFSYHGNTLGALASSGNHQRRIPYEAVLLQTHRIAPCHAYRYQRAEESDLAYAARAADELEQMIHRLGPETVMAFVAETVVGATLGAVPAVADYWRRVREICDRHGVLLIMDEVMCGMGRTGTLHACEQEAVVPDLLTIAKGLGGGYQPIGAVLLHERIFGCFRDGSGSFKHGHTYLAHPVAAAAALAVQRFIREEGLLRNVRDMGALLHRQLVERLGGNPYVGDIRGRGLLLGLEFVADRESRAPLAPSLGLNARIKAEAMARGLMVYPGGATADGVRGDHVLLAPPYVLSEQHVDAIVTRLGDAVEAAIATVAAHIDHPSELAP